MSGEGRRKISKSDALRESVDYFVSLIAEKLNLLDVDVRVIKEKRGRVEGEYLWREWLRKALRSRGKVYRFMTYLWRPTGESDVFRYVVAVSAEVSIYTGARAVVTFKGAGEVGLYYVPKKCLSRLIMVGDVEVSVVVSRDGSRFVVVADDEELVNSFVKSVLEAVKDYVPSVDDMCMETLVGRESFPFVYR